MRGTGLGGCCAAALITGGLLLSPLETDAQSLRSAPLEILEFEQFDDVSAPRPGRSARVEFLYGWRGPTPDRFMLDRCEAVTEGKASYQRMSDKDRRISLVLPADRQQVCLRLSSGTGAARQISAVARTVAYVGPAHPEIRSFRRFDYDYEATVGGAVEHPVRESVRLRIQTVESVPTHYMLGDNADFTHDDQSEIWHEWTGTNEATIDHTLRPGPAGDREIWLMVRVGDLESKPAQLVVEYEPRQDDDR